MICPRLKVSNYQRFIAHFQRAVGIPDLAAGVIAPCFILPAAKKSIRFQ
jgi:hypothetical protein